MSSKVILLLENTAGQKNSVGSSFEDLKWIMSRIKQKERVAVCFDTCHAFVAGYDLRNKESVQITMNHFDKIIGHQYLKVVHLNDSKGCLGCKTDRHEHIGLGHIGETGFRAILHCVFFRNLPLILETPVDSQRGDDENLQNVRELYR